ncbi:MAG: hypothetical protein AAFY36_06910, partial [Bacteroidota bacterium]
KFLWLFAALAFVFSACNEEGLFHLIDEDQIDRATYEQVEGSIQLLEGLQLPTLMLDDLVNSDLTVFGETHYVQEHHEFLVSILPLLSELGYRVIFDELFHAMSWAVEDYTLGELDELPEYVRFFNQELIEGLRSFNATVDEEKRIRLVYFDINHWGDNLIESLELIETVLGHQELFIGIKNQSPNSQTYEQALYHLSEELVDRESVLRSSLGDLWYERLIDIVKVEMISLEFCLARDDVAREEQMFRNIMAVCSNDMSNKHLVNTGMSHAQKVNYMSGNTTRIAAMLADEIERVHTISFIGLRGERKFRFYETETFTFDLVQASQNNDMTKYLAEFSGTKRSYMPLDHDHFSENLQRISYTQGTTVFAHVGVQFDAIFTYPEISVLRSMDEFDWE